MNETWPCLKSKAPPCLNTTRPNKILLRGFDENPLFVWLCIWLLHKAYLVANLFYDIYLFFHCSLLTLFSTSSLAISSLSASEGWCWKSSSSKSLRSLIVFLSWLLDSATYASNGDNCLVGGFPNRWLDERLMCHRQHLAESQAFVWIRFGSSSQEGHGHFGKDVVNTYY